MNEETVTSAIPSPLGMLEVELVGNAVTSIVVNADSTSAMWNTTGVPVLDELAAQLSAYFAGELQTFTVPLAPSGTPFQQSVWAELRKIGYGDTRTYGDIAASLGKPGASRAVGAANGANPIPIIIPCHRVTAAGGKLGGYSAGGPSVKRKLLDLEQGTLFR
ncbi:MAG: methylated-DNA--[protein]-cysteine S-methyltransferase, partial [Planctomycetota bacterium]